MRIDMTMEKMYCRKGVTYIQFRITTGPLAGKLVSQRYVPSPGGSNGDAGSNSRDKKA